MPPNNKMKKEELSSNPQQVNNYPTIPFDVNETIQTEKKLKTKGKETLSPVSREASLNASAVKSPSNEKSHNNKSKPMQACDRCRSKKIRCDLKKPQCSACASVGFECKFTDKLLRKTHPRGYTESLEERIRELEAENRKLSALSDMKQQQITYLQNVSVSDNNNIPQQQQPQIDIQQPCPLPITDSNHVCDGMCMHNTLHQQPVATSFNLNDPTSISFEQDRAPGLMAAKALDTLASHEDSTQLAILVSLSVPRSTEEILFVPQFLSKIRQEYGFTSKQCLYSVTLLASLKDDLPSPFLKQNSMMLLNCSKDFDTLTNKNLWQIQNLYHFIHTTLKFDILSNLKKEQASKKEKDTFTLKFDEIDELINLFFTFWSQMIPVLNEEEFRKYYQRFKRDINSLEKMSVSSQPINNLLNIKYFACLLVVLCQMGIVTKFKESKTPLPSKYSKLLSYYHHVLHILPRNSFFSVTTTSIRTLQLLCLILYYFLNTGDIVQLYDLRGTIVTMSQQLRLHRCPSAVLTGSGKKMQKLEQSNRRRLFWCTYYLDVFASFQLGVPRLLKDHEIECALPFALDDQIKHTSEVKLEGYVTTFSLAVIRFAKIMGNILDSIFKRTVTNDNVIQTATIHENALDTWRKSLSKQYQIEIDVTGKTILDSVPSNKTLLIILFQLAKCMIQLPICAAVMLPATSNGDTESTTRIRSLPSYIALQQSVNTLLTAYRQLKEEYIPLPVNTSRIMTRFALISAKESLEYKKYGKLFEENKELLLGVIKDIEVNRRLELPGVISWYSLEMLDLTINFFLQIPVLKGDKLEKFLQKKINYYKAQMGSSPSLEPSKSEKPTKRRHSSQENESGKNKKKIKIPNEPKELVQISLPPDALNKEINKLTTQNNDSSQNQLLEALQDDPILNGNPGRFSSLNLSNFFGSSTTINDKKSADNPDTNKKVHVPPSLTASIDTVNSVTSPSFFANPPVDSTNDPNSNIKSQLNSASFSNMMLLLNNEGTLSQLNLDTLYDNGNLFESSSEKAENKARSQATGNNKNNYTVSKGNGMVDFGSIIDASLGLAPLLIDNNGNNNLGKEPPLNPNIPNQTHITNQSPTLNPQSSFDYKQPTGRERDRTVVEDISRWQNR
ncbi:regulatory protein Cat8p [Monosporozyma unispora]